ncbi:capsular biosynthesis protein [Helicobacter sp. MIT 21-1697]|uniref:capsular biosynthesis protein n=1 Tax=Helicobacter sp. MIT 21-1697 TaxID=2993733 RepID=UPI00224B99AC|nr:capsular biosynthesis protein [Helicobacter sp. MIT 21-1697]MCX2717085.1 capsular biosynthesis protein [Helicobacter sp. MIT 21-1697]
MCEYETHYDEYRAEAKPRILILAAANISTCPRPMRMVEVLKDDYDISVMGIDNEDGTPMPPVFIKGEAAQTYEVKSFSYPSFKKRNAWGEVKLWINVALRRWDKLSFIPNRLAIIEHLCKESYDVVICHDLLLLPVLFAGLKKSGRKCGKKNDIKVVFDAREFYPLQNTSSLRWRLLFKRFNIYLCAHFASQADVLLSVSPRFCELYKEHFGLKAHLLMSLPQYYPFEPTPINPQKIKILYHGALNRNRDIDKVIEICQYLDKRFCIDFIFTGGTQSYRKKIQSRIAQLQSEGNAVRILPPVELTQIVPFGNAYDIGLLYIPVHNHNLLATIPNKFFEYIQSRLAVLMPPLQQLQGFGDTYKNFIVAKDFAIKSLADSLNVLSSEEIEQLKCGSHAAAQELNLAQNAPFVRKMLKELLAQ